MSDGLGLTVPWKGVVGFGEPLPAPGTPLVVGALGMIVLVAGVAVLARSPLLHPAGGASAGATTVATGSGKRPEAA